MQILHFFELNSLYYYDTHHIPALLVDLLSVHDPFQPSLFSAFVFIRFIESLN